MKLTFLSTVMLFVAPLTGIGQTTIHVPTDQPTIQAAIDSAADGDTVVVAAGVYDEALDLNTRQLTLRSELGPEMTTLSGAQLDAPIMSCWTGAEVLIEGFTLRDGFDVSADAGLSGRDSSIAVRDCWFLDNTSGSGGAINTTDSVLVVEDCRFDGNRSHYGGAIATSAFLASSELVVRRSLFQFNDMFNPLCCDGLGAAILVSDQALIENCVFRGNHTWGEGGAIYAWPQSTISIDHSTFYNNSPQSNVIYLRSTAAADIRNSIVWHNNDVGPFSWSENQPTVSFSCIRLGAAGEGNIDANPLIMSDGRLFFDSPCINTGIPIAGVDTDHDGAPRDLCGGVDMGAYEARYCSSYQRGDCNDDGAIDISDGVRLLEYLFSSASAPLCLAACDMNDDGDHDIGDPVYLYNYLLLGGPEPAAPFGECSILPAENCQFALSCP